MKILLIMPPTQTYTKFYKGKIHFPFSIWYLGTYYKSQGNDVTLLDLNITDKYPDDWFDIVGISCMTTQIPATREILKKVSYKYPNATKMIGGIHPTLYPQQTADYKLCDTIVTGHVIKDFKNMPMLDYTLLDSSLLTSPKKNFVGLVTSIGCPFKCGFCVNSIIKEYQKWQAWSAERICDEIEKAQTYGFHNVFFWDDNFFTSKQRIEEFLCHLDNRKLNFEWFALTRIDQIDRKLFTECYKRGLRRISVGAESGSQQVLDRLQKRISIRVIEEKAKILEEIGIEISYSYMIGLPSETKSDILTTVSAIKQLGNIHKYPKIVGPMLFQPYPGSKLYEECKKAGYKEPQRFEDWTNETSGNIDTPFKMPWIAQNQKNMVEVYWWYSFLIPLKIGAILRIFRLFCKRTNKKLWYLTPFIVFAAILGKIRHHLRFYWFPVEVKIFKKFRMLTGL